MLDTLGAPSTLLALSLALLALPVTAQDVPVTRIIDFGSGEPGSWLRVNDGVMGGRSSSDLRRTDEGTAVFSGTLSLENNGGFASVRTEVAEGALAGASAVLLRIRGDGHRYQLRLRPSGRFDGVAFGAGFDTQADRWITVSIPLDAFEPTFRGYRPPNVGALDPGRVRQIGIMLTDEQEGPFRLEIAWVGVT